jgi:spore germination cell wall hydrolase CwlJ-like protein
MMNKSKTAVIGLALSLALTAAAGWLVFGAGPAVAETIQQEGRAETVLRAMSRERAGLTEGGADRISSLSQSLRPKARSEVSVATRGVQPRIVTVKSAARPLDASTLDSLPGAAGDEQWQCLAEAIYYEARGEPLSGQIAVAEVVLNRVQSRNYPNSICSVTRQGVGSGRACQFSYACDGAPERMASAKPRERAEKLARAMIDGYPRALTDGATHFHATYVSPRWARQMTRTAAIGQHLFYRPGTRTAQR